MAHSELQYSVTDTPDPADISAVDAGLDAFNRQHANPAAVRPLGCSVRSASGEVVGGILARTWGECCELQQIWVDDRYRRSGVGRRLVELLEHEARERGCTLVYLDTFSFQAPDFYRRLGFDVACEFRGFPNGIAKFIMRKHLVR